MVERKSMLYGREVIHLASLIKDQPWVYDLPDEAKNWSRSKRVKEAKWLLNKKGFEETVGKLEKTHPAYPHLYGRKIEGLFELE